MKCDEPTSSFAKSRDRGTNGDDGFASLRRVRPPRSCIRSLVPVLRDHSIGDYRQSNGPSVRSVACGTRVRDGGRSCRGRRVQSARARRAAGRAHFARGHVGLRHLWRATTNGRGCRRAFAERAHSAQTASGDPSRRRLRDGYRVWRTPAAEGCSTKARAEEVARGSSARFALSRSHRSQSIFCCAGRAIAGNPPEPRVGTLRRRRGVRTMSVVSRSIQTTS